MSDAAIKFTQDMFLLWDEAENACDDGGFVEGHIQRLVNEYCKTDDATLADFVEAIGRRANAILKASA